MAENTTILNITAKDQTKVAFDSVQSNIDRMNRNGVRANTNLDRSARQSRAGLAQFSYQIQDISVQLQGGQSPFIVLAQQGSQIASIFGAGGAVFGAIVAVGAGIATALLPALFDSTTALEKIKEAGEDVDKTFKALDSGIIGLSDSFLKMAEASGVAATIELRRQRRELLAAMATTQSEMIEQAKSFNAVLERAMPQTGLMFEIINANSAGALAAVAKQYQTLYGITEENIRSLQELSSAAMSGNVSDIEAFVTALSEIQNQPGVTAEFNELAESLSALMIATMNGTEQVGQLEAAIADIDGFINKSTESNDENADSLENMISKLQYQALTFDMSASQIAVYDGILANANITQLTTIQQLAQEIEARQQNSESIKAQAAAEENLRKERESADEAARRKDERATENMLRKEERAVEDSYRRQQEAIQTIQKEQTQAMSEPDRIAAEFDERIRITYEALQELGWLETEHANLLIRLNQEKAAAVAQSLYDEEQARRETVQSQISLMSSMASSIANSLEEGTAVQKAAYLVSQGLAFADAIISAELASAKALALFPQNPAYAGMIKAMGYASAGVIAGQTIASFEGGGFTGFGARAGGIDGRGGMPAIVHPNETIIDHTMGGGAVNVNITIQANDTRGFDELLNKRRGMIASMVQSSLNNMGRSI
jgi:hypothetical protein